jgi:hypothetical protein
VIYFVARWGYGLFWEEGRRRFQNSPASLGKFCCNSAEAHKYYAGCIGRYSLYLALALVARATSVWQFVALAVCWRDALLASKTFIRAKGIASSESLAQCTWPAANLVILQQGLTLSGAVLFCQL